MNKHENRPLLQVAQDGETDIIVRRSFHHPASQVWRAMTDPALIPKWMASRDTMTRCEIDLRPGGSFYYEWRGGQENSFHFSGPILEVKPPHRMIHVEYFNGHEETGTTVETILEATGFGTRMTIVMRYADAEARTAAIKMGMTDGLDRVYENLEALLDAE